jgi:hypothetical protein
LCGSEYADTFGLQSGLFLLVQNLKGRGYFKHVGVDGAIILK